MSANAIIMLKNGKNMQIARMRQSRAMAANLSL